MSETRLPVGSTQGAVRVVLKNTNVWRGLGVARFMFTFEISSKQQTVTGCPLWLGGRVEVLEQHGRVRPYLAGFQPQTLAELSAGPHHASDPAERARRMSVLQHAESTFEPLPFDTEAARAFGLISAAVLAAGRTPRRRIADLMIASTAVANRLPLYTTNAGDFTGLGGLSAIVAVQRP